MTTILCLSGAALIKAGVNRHISGADVIDGFINQAESVVNTRCNYNWNDVYTTLNADVKYILEDTVSNLAAIYLINYDMSGYTSRAEAQSMIDVLNFCAERNLKLLEQQAKKDFIIGA